MSESVASAQVVAGFIQYVWLIPALPLLAFPQSHIPVAIANWLMLLGVAALVPYLQRRRLATLRARLAAQRVPLMRAGQP